MREIFLAESTRAVKCCCSLAFFGVPVLDYQKLDAMAQQWPFSERRLKKILQNLVEETQWAREGVYTWLTVESLNKEIDNILDDLTKEVFLKSFEDGEHELAIHFMNLHLAKLLETCEQFVESTIKRIKKEKERS